MAATTLRWPGMMMKKTFADMAVATIAPTSKKAARPANNWQAAQAAKITKNVTMTATTVSPCSRSLKARHAPS